MFLKKKQSSTVKTEIKNKIDAENGAVIPPPVITIKKRLDEIVEDRAARGSGRGRGRGKYLVFLTFLSGEPGCGGIFMAAAVFQYSSSSHMASFYGAGGY